MRIAQRNLISTFAPGVLSGGQVKHLAGEGLIRHFAGEADASSFDLRIKSGACWRLKKGVVKPNSTDPYTKILNDSTYARKYTLRPNRDLPIRAGETFIFQIEEEVVIKQPIHARATGKSSIGRLDVLVRLIGDKKAHYDLIDPPFTRQLYVEVSPITFPIHVRAGNSVCQLRLFKGHPDLCRVSSRDLRNYCEPILYEEKAEELRVSTLPGKVSRRDTPTATAFVAKPKEELKNIPPISLGARGESIPPRRYWDLQQSDGKCMHIKQNRFYILRSVERFRLPSDLAVYAKAMNETIGEMRIHYAGFVHPHFGTRKREQNGTPLIFEVRGHNLDVLLRHEEILAELEYYRMSEPAEPGEDTYDDQELKLAKFFRPWRQ